MRIDELMALIDEYVSTSIEDHGYRAGATSADNLATAKRDLLAALESLIAAPAAPVQFDFLAHVRRHIEFSERTFGPGMRTAGVIDHICKELREVEADPTDLEEWVDVWMLALDGAWRCGATPEQIVAQIESKQAKNEARSWPDWRTVPLDRAIEHDRTGETAAPVQQADPVAWMAFGGALVHAVTRNAMDPIEAERFDVPLYLHPPAAPQQAEPCDVCNALTVPRNATHYDADDLKAAQVRGKIIAAKLQQQAEPVAQIGWSDEFGNLFPMGAWKPTQRTHHDSHKAAWRPVFLHPPADEVRRLRDALEQIEHEANQPYIQRIARRALAVKLDAIRAAPQQAEPQQAEPQQAEPVAQIGWADEFGNLFPMGAWKPTQRTHHDSHKTAWRAVYLHPPAAEVHQAEPVATLYQCLGRWSVELVTGGGNAELAPPQYLLDAIADATRQQAAAEVAPTGPRTPDPTMVICPACTSQFTATPESVQAEVQRLRDALDEIESETQDVSIQQIARKALEGK